MPDDRMEYFELEAGSWSDSLCDWLRRCEEIRDRRYDAQINGYLPGWYDTSENTDEMPSDRDDDAPCINCSCHWGDHSGWACPPTVGIYRGAYARRSELVSEARYLTQDMKEVEKKFSRVSRSRLRKLEREQLLSKESLLK